MKNKILAIVGLAISISAASASAAIPNLSSRDYLASGDGLITYDASTNLEWLDLTFTVGNSVHSGETTLAFFDNSAANGKFRWARDSEIVQLMSNMPFASALTTSTQITSLNASDFADAEAFIGLLGYTYNAAINGFDATQGVSRESDIGGGHFGLGTVTARPSDNFALARAPILSCCVLDTEAGANVGLWLVRPASPVPVPAALWLLAPALGGIGFMRRRRAS